MYPGFILLTTPAGTARTQLIAAADWYSTFAALAGVDPTDSAAAAHHLPPIDSHDQTSVLFPNAPSSNGIRTHAHAAGYAAHNGSSSVGAGGSRTDIVLSATAIVAVSGGALYKLIAGKVAMDAWVGPRYPNASTFNSAKYGIKNCGTGCLFDVAVDPTE